MIRKNTISAGGELVDFDEDGLPDVVMAYAPCPTGSKVTGGGMEKYTSLPAFLSMPEDNGWLVVTEADETTAAGDAWAHAQCYNPRGAVSGASQSALRTAYTPGEDVKKRMLRALDK